ncbi:DUF2262 domain-containing protein [Isobaculum melis]|uniref:Uncharacterized protein n=1 Tax=Isobaculum melis TaxID=142588 RepID=A0A1H9U5J2_9LACT|nr:DUF2262 domain-containing protein [Isobaculum melis]SES04508.1 hypothetical protein SAMN04488559_12152 [Isobaculum melis]
MSADKIIVPNLLEWEIQDEYAEFFPYMFGDHRLVGADFAHEIAEISHENTTKISAKIQDMIDWIFTHQSNIAKEIIAKDYIHLAEKWVTELGEKVEGLDNCYLVYERKEAIPIQLPLSKQVFSNAIEYSSINFIFDKNNQLDTCIIYVTFKPDYFSSHAIEVCLDADYTITVGGL